MKKVGIITFYDSMNYGTCYQAFAIQNLIESLGFEAEIVNVSRKTKKIKKNNVFHSYLKAAFESKLMVCKVLGYRKYKNNVMLKFMDFRKMFLNIKPFSPLKTSELGSIENYYDAFVCGSDMIWSSDRSDSLETYFLTFAPYSKRISYAPSFGSSTIEPQYLNLYKELINGIRFLSCRDSFGIELIDRLCNRKAELVLDPTLLLSKDKWVDLFLKEANNEPFEPYILCYLFEGLCNEFKKNVFKFGKQLGLKVKFVPMSFSDYLMSEKQIQSSSVGPNEFIALIQNASYVVTNSYHGLMFSLVFNKPFFILKRNRKIHWAQFENRIISVLTLFGLENRLIDDKTDLAFFSMALDLDYHSINKLLDQFRKDSKLFLEQALCLSTNSVNSDC